MATKTRTTSEKAENTANTEEVKGNTAEKTETKENAKIEAVEGTFIYVGPTLETGLRKNAVFHGTRESVEKHLKSTIEKYPQSRLLLITTGSLAEAQAKVRKTGTLLNKYYTDLVSLSRKQ